MQIKNSLYKIRGMNKDLSYSTFNPEYSWENKNIRITAIDSNNLFGITNERGNSKLLFNDITPQRPIVYTYSYLFNNYLNEQIELTYQYDISFLDYFVEQSDGWLPPVSYEYNITFENYLNEQENI